MASEIIEGIYSSYSEKGTTANKEADQNLGKKIVDQMPRSMKISAVSDLVQAFNFVVTLNEFTYGFMEVSNIEVERQVSFIDEGGVNDHQLMVGEPNTSNKQLEFKRGMILQGPTSVTNAFTAAAAGVASLVGLSAKMPLIAVNLTDAQASLERGPSLGMIQVYGRDKRLKAMYSFISLGMLSWKLDTLDANNHNVLLESITIVHTGITRHPVTLTTGNLAFSAVLNERNQNTESIEAKRAERQLESEDERKNRENQLKDEIDAYNKAIEDERNLRIELENAKRQKAQKEWDDKMKEIRDAQDEEKKGYQVESEDEGYQVESEDEENQLKNEIDAYNKAIEDKRNLRIELENAKRQKAQKEWDDKMKEIRDAQDEEKKGYDEKKNKHEATMNSIEGIINEYKYRRQKQDDEDKIKKDEAEIKRKEEWQAKEDENQKYKDAREAEEVEREKKRKADEDEYKQEKENKNNEYNAAKDEKETERLAKMDEIKAEQEEDRAQRDAKAEKDKELLKEQEEKLKERHDEMEKEKQEKEKNKE